MLKKKNNSESTDLALFVRTSSLQIVKWNRQKIADALVRETDLDPKIAQFVCKEVETFVKREKIKFITAPLIRELVNAKLIEYGYENVRKQHTRLGFPIYDVANIITAQNKENANVPHGPEATNLTLAEGVKKEYALLNVFSSDVADAHMNGEIHLHDLGFIDRPYCSGNSLEYVKKFGLNLPNALSIASPAKHPEVLLGQMIKFSAALQGTFAGAIGWDAVNLFFSPYLEGADDKRLEQLAQMLIFEFAQQAVARGGQSIFSDLNLYWEVPNHFKDVPAIGPGGKFTGNNYDDYHEEAQRFVNALLNVYLKGDAKGRPFFFPKPQIHITERFFKTEGHEDFLNLAANVSSEKGNPYYVFDRGDTAKISECFTPETMVMMRVAGNSIYTDIETAFKRIKKERLDKEWYEPKEEVFLPSVGLKTGEQKFTRVTGLLRKQYSGNAYIVTLEDGSSIKVTEKHPLRVLRKGELKKVPTSELNVGDFLPLSTKLPLIESIDSIDLVQESIKQEKTLYVYGFEKEFIKLVYKKRSKKYDDYRHNLDKGRLPASIVIEEGIEYSDKYVGLKHTNLPSVSAVLALNREFGRFVGLFLAEGILEKQNELVFSFNKNEEDLIKFVTTYAKQKLGRNVRFYKDKRRASCRVVFSSSVMTWLLKEILQIGSSRTSKDKQLGSLFFESPKKFRKGVISGFLEGEGYIRDKNGSIEVSFHLASKQLSEDLRNLMKTLSINSTMRSHLQKNPRNRTQLLGSYTVLVSSSDLSLLNSNFTGKESKLWDVFPFKAAGIPFADVRITPSRYSKQNVLMLSVADRLINCQNHWLDLIQKTNLRFLRIKSIEKVPYDGNVYDFEVEDSEHIFQLPNSLYTSNCCRLSFKLEQPDLDDAKTPWKMRYSAMHISTLNLPRVAYEAKGNDDKLFQLIRERVALIAKAHTQKRKFLKSLLNMKNRGPLGLLSMTCDGEPYYRFKKASFLLGMVGLNEMVQHHTGKQMHESKDAFKFGLKTIAFMRKEAQKQGEEHDLKFIMEQTPAESTAHRMARLDMKMYPEQAKKLVRGFIDSGHIYYTNSTYLNAGVPISPIERVKKEGQFHPMIEAGSLTHIWLGEAKPNPESISKFVVRSFKNTENDQIAFSPEFTHCLDCGKTMRGLPKGLRT